MVKKIQEFQKKFDDDHFSGWNNIDYNEKLLYLSTALAGEVGELANIIKKRHRKKIHGLAIDNLKEEEYTQKIKEEIVDVFIYTIIFCNSLNIDLEQEYYKKSEKLKIKFKNGSTKR